MPNNNLSVDNVEVFIDGLTRDQDGHVVLNMFDNSILHGSHLESLVRCGAPGHEPKPEKIRFVQQMNPWSGITYFTDKVLSFAPHVESAVKVAWVIEPGNLIPGLHDLIKSMQDHYDLIFTYEQNLLDFNPEKFKFLHASTCSLERASHKVHKKTKLVSMVYSDKKWLAGHRVRHMVANDLLPKIRYDKVDLFGRGTPRPLKMKSEGTNEYMFQIAIENMRRPNFFSDKIYDCFVTGTIPIYWGCPNIGDFFDERGILIFDSPKDLAEILFSLSEGKYEEMLPYVEKNFELVKAYLSPDDLLFEETKKHLRQKYNQ